MPHPSGPIRVSLYIAGTYFVTAAAWILFSDRLAVMLAHDLASMSWFQTAKGIAFVAITGVLLFGLCFRRFRALARTHERLQESERRHRMLLGNLPGMAYRCQADALWTMQFVSKGCADLTGYEPQQLLHNREIAYGDLIHPDDADQVRASVERALEQGIPYRLEYRILTATGEDRWVWEQGGPVYDERGELVALEGFIGDITDRKYAEQIERERQKLNEAMCAADRVLGVVGHELRNPLAGLQAMSEMLLMDSLAAEQRQELLQTLHDQTIQLTTMANNMLEAARQRNGAAAWLWEPVSIRQICEDAIAVMQPIAARRETTLTLALPANDPSLIGDPEALRRLLVNILSNACKHTQGGTIVVRARLEGEEPPEHVSLEVEDTGTGMNEETIAKLGRAFAFSAGSVSNETMASVGLGLAICCQIVKAHGGRMLVRSRPGNGTTFTVRLPAETAGPRQVGDGDPAEVLSVAA